MREENTCGRGEEEQDNICSLKLAPYLQLPLLCFLVRERISRNFLFDLGCQNLRESTRARKPELNDKEGNSFFRRKFGKCGKVVEEKAIADFFYVPAGSSGLIFIFPPSPYG